MDTGIYIGGASTAALEGAREIIEAILNSANAEAVKIEALKTLVALAPAPTTATISGAHIDGSESTTTHNHYAEPEPPETELDDDL